MKLLTFTVPCFNSQAYLNKCIDSLLVGGDDVEIIIVNDGSTDGTLAIARDYERAYPNIVRVIDKPNGGHGSGVNAGLNAAQGLFFKVVDSDDWLDGEALKTLLDTIKTHIESGVAVDMYITNFVYEHDDGNNYISRYGKNFPVGEVFGWERAKPLKLWKMLLMHSLVYSTERLRVSNTVLPENTSYVDNLFAYKPLPFMQRLYYANINLYKYYIGRSDQSVSVKNMTARYSQQIRVMKCMFESHSYAELKKMCKPLRAVMYHCLTVIMLNTYFFTTSDDSPERRRDLAEMWQSFKTTDKKLYKKLWGSASIRLLRMVSWRMKGKLTKMSYKFLCKHVRLGV